MTYRFTAEITGAGGSALGDVSLQPDWTPLREWCHFQGVCEGRRLYFANAGSVLVEPVWHAEAGPPFVQKLRVGLTDADGDWFHCEVPARFLRADVEKAAETLVADGSLTGGEHFGFRLCAFPDPAGGARTRTAGSGGDELEGDAVAVSVALHRASLGALIAGSQRRSGEHWADADLPVFIPAQVIEELQTMACADAQVESGAILIGRLCVDTDDAARRPAVFVEVTAQIPAEHTIAQRASLTFTGETWAAFDGVLRLRAREELATGWAHVHPHFCRDCDAASRRLCPLAKPMFSAADVNVHKTVFSHPYQIALLLSFLGKTRPRVDLFAWRDGQVAQRGYYVF